MSLYGHLPMYVLVIAVKQHSQQISSVFHLLKCYGRLFDSVALKCYGRLFDSVEPFQTAPVRAV